MSGTTAGWIAIGAAVVAVARARARVSLLLATLRRVRRAQTVVLGSGREDLVNFAVSLQTRIDDLHRAVDEVAAGARAGRQADRRRALAHGDRPLRRVRGRRAASSRPRSRSSTRRGRESSSRRSRAVTTRGSTSRSSTAAARPSRSRRRSRRPSSAPCRPDRAHAQMTVGAVQSDCRPVINAAGSRSQLELRAAERLLCAPGARARVQGQGRGGRGRSTGRSGRRSTPIPGRT